MVLSGPQVEMTCSHACNQKEHLDQKFLNPGSSAVFIINVNIGENEVGSLSPHFPKLFPAAVFGNGWPHLWNSEVLDWIRTSIFTNLELHGQQYHR